MNKKLYTHKLGNADLVFEINDWMEYTEASVIASMGDTKVMVALALGGPTDKDYMPLKVEYQERYYARGEILGGKYNKREGRPSTEATLTARVIDRAIRPFFPEGFNREILVVITVLSLGDYDPDIVAMNATTMALEISSIPWRGTVGGVRVVQNKDGVQTISPTYKEREDNNSFDAVISVRDGRLCMLEVEGSEASEEAVASGVADAVNEVNKLTDFMQSVVSEYQKPQLEVLEKEDRLVEEFNQHITPLVQESLWGIQEKVKRAEWMDIFSEKVLATYEDATKPEIRDSFEHGIKTVTRKEILQNGKRMDGRDTETVRPLFAEAGGVSDKLHGSGLFYRGQTHVLSIVTLGQLQDALFIQGMEVNTEKTFIHHYNFPPYSVGEVGRMGSPKRREIGHGALAEKALRRMIPSQDDFPYTMRVVSEILSSNGSTSMGSVCGASLALHDAGVPIKSHVAGIAIGLVYESDDNYTLVTDILGKEDYYGDMDFKVAGTHEGITAIQLDCKFDGLTNEMIVETLKRAKTARETILGALESELTKPRELSKHVDMIEKIDIPKSMIGLVIGKGGVTIKKITKDSGARLNIKRDGTAFIMGNTETIAKARTLVEQIIANSKERS